MIKKEWRLKQRPDSQSVEKLSTELNIGKDLTDLLFLRGIDSFDKAKAFFRPSLEDLHDPFLMKDMDKAVARIAEAWGNGEKILVYGDYDVDGTTSVALVYSFLKDKGEADFYIPDRYDEGYGLSEKGIHFAKDNGFSIIITLDCGIRATDKAALATELGVDLIICDHHIPGDDLPNAAAVLDPKRSDCGYPFKELCGCGVGFKLIQALSIRHDFPLEDVFANLDLVAIAIAADIVDVVGENRILTHFGMDLINRHPRPSVRKMLEEKKRNGPLSVSDVVFSIGPRINAAGRIGSGKTAVELLIEEDRQKLSELYANITELNLTRRGLDKGVTEDAMAELADNPELLDKRSVVVFNKDWHKGVIGIVASRIVDVYYRPTIVLTESDGMVTGSARSVQGFDVHEAIGQCADLLEQFGGHQAAAGVTMKPENVEAFKVKFEQVVSSSIKEEHLTPWLEVDSQITLGKIDDKFFRILRQLAPFGPGNMNPVFRTNRLSAVDVSRVGADKTHLRLKVADPYEHRKHYVGIGFNLGHHFDALARGEQFDLVYTIEENHWNGKVNLQLNIKDIKTA